jgi:hypothetical protein
MERGGVMHLGSGRRSAELGVGGGGYKKRGDGKTQKEAGPHSENGKTMIERKNTKHSD